jgi:hypothetical protein
MVYESLAAGIEHHSRSSHLLHDTVNLFVYPALKETFCFRPCLGFCLCLEAQDEQ